MQYPMSRQLCLLIPFLTIIAFVFVTMMFSGGFRTFVQMALGLGIIAYLFIEPSSDNDEKPKRG